MRCLLAFEKCLFCRPFPIGYTRCANCAATCLNFACKVTSPKSLFSFANFAIYLQVHKTLKTSVCCRKHPFPVSNATVCKLYCNVFKFCVQGNLAEKPFFACKFCHLPASTQNFENLCVEVVRFCRQRHGVIAGQKCAKCLPCEKNIL